MNSHEMSRLVLYLIFLTKAWALVEIFFKLDEILKIEVQIDVKK